MLIARLIADPATLDRRLDAASAALAQRGMGLAGASLLDHWGDVLELTLPGDDLPALKQVIRDHFDPSDAIIARDEIRVPDLFVSDMDSTMIGQECIDELADFAGLKDRVAAITERAMRGELDFAAALHERVALLEGLEEEAIGTCLATRIHPVPGARVLVATLRHRGCRTVLVTGGFHHFADPLAERLGFDRVVGNRLSVADGKLDGRLAGPISDAASKERTLREELSLLGEQAVSMAAGDGANDIPMLRTASYGIAYRAKPAAREAASGWVERGDLTALLKLVGIPEHEWVAG